MKSKTSLTPVQLIVGFYFLFMIAGAFLLAMPFALQPGKNLSWIDALFTSASAISVTGLTVVNTGNTFSLPGQLILVFMLQIGGIGIMTLGTLIFIALGKKIGLKERKLIQRDHNQTDLQGLVLLMLRVFKIALVIEFVGFVLLGIAFLREYNDPAKALYLAFFHAISGFTNGGFDLFGNSLIGFQKNFFVQVVVMALFFSGAIGFPVLIETKQFISTRGKHRFSLFTRITTITFIVLIVLGFFLILFVERNNALSSLSWSHKFINSLFHSLTTRSGGFSTMDVTQFQPVTLAFMSILMFIGASPSSCGGGIRTTTFAVITFSIMSFIRGKKDVQVFNRELWDEDINKSFVVLVVSLFLLVLGMLTLLYLEPFPPLALLFELCSAFGTTGLSMGLSQQFTIPGKLILIVFMFIGRIGVLSALLIASKNISRSDIHYPKEKVIIG